MAAPVSFSRWFGISYQGLIVGNFYTNFTVRGGAQEQVVSALRSKQRRAFVSPLINNMVVVYDAESDEQKTDVIDRLGRDLSATFDCAVIAVLNHDDDILCYWLFQSGQLLDDYNSAPNYFESVADPCGPAGGDVMKLCRTCASTVAPERVEAILRKSALEEGGFLFQIDRHQALAEALGLPECSVGLGYTYLERGELPQIEEAQFVRVG